MEPLRVVMLSDTDSWIQTHLSRIQARIEKLRPMSVTLINSHEDPDFRGDVSIILSYTKVIPMRFLSAFRQNLVVHESRLPEGRGMSPLTWQILEGRNSIPITLFEAAEGCDDGNIYFRDELVFSGHELVDELRAGQAEGSARLLERFFREYPPPARPQSGEKTQYRRRTPKDSELDIKKSIAEQFNLLRVCDNERYPAFFWHQGHKYIVKVFKDE